MNKKCVLIVDDDEPIRDSLRDFFELYDFSVACAREGDEALQILESGEQTPNLIIFDTRMPKCDGWQFKKALEADTKLRDIPNFVFTATQNGYPPGIKATGYIPKPINLTRLELILKDYLK